MAQVSYDDFIGLMNAEFNSFPDGSLGGEISYILDAARINADDTMKEGTDQSWEAIAMATLEQQCCYAEKHQMEAVAWFVSHGLKF